MVVLATTPSPSFPTARGKTERTGAREVEESEGWEGGKDGEEDEGKKGEREALTFLNVVGLDRLDATLYVSR